MIHRALNEDASSHDARQKCFTRSCECLRLKHDFKIAANHKLKAAYIGHGGLYRYF